MIYVIYLFFFFFQAEDGIRDLTVTGVQTCALPIYLRSDLVQLCYGLLVEAAGQRRETDLGEQLLAVAEQVTQVGLEVRSEEHTSELQSQSNLVCRLLLEKKKG